MQTRTLIRLSAAAGLSAMLLASWPPPAIAARTVITGFVRAGSGEPLPYANVFFSDGFEGTMADSDGEYVLLPKTFGQREIVASYIGRETTRRTITIVEGDSLHVEIIMRESPIVMPAIVSEASAYTVGDDEGVTLTSLDVVRTPGAAADVFRALQTFPGLAQVDEGAGLYVRGGDISETLTLLDRATVVYPYRYASPTGGFFGMFDPFLLDGIHFSTGGFPARWGNALSGVVDLRSLGVVEKKTLGTTVSLAAISAMGAIPVNNRWGVRFAGNRTHTEALFRVNGGLQDFGQVPESTDGSVSIIGRVAETGVLKLFTFQSNDDIGVAFDSPAYDGQYDGNGRTRLANATYAQLFGDKLLLETSLSASGYRQFSQLGALDLTNDDNVRKARLDTRYEVGERLQFRLGGEAVRRASDISGTVPVDENDFSPAAETDTFETRYRSVRAGGYIETSVRPTSRLLVNLGVRADYETNTEEVTQDPRLSIVLQTSRHGGLRLAYGIYHQTPDPGYFDPYVGNPDLHSMQATHYIVGYDYQRDAFRFRVESYYKRYEDLLLDDDDVNITNNGVGDARGVDVFLKGNAGFVEGRVAYSYLEARRRESDKLRLVPADFDITHTLNVVALFPMPWRLEYSMGYRYATGRPYTPAADAHNSARLPTYERIDMALSKLHSFGDGNLTVFFVSVSNIFDEENIQGYIYAPDFSERTTVKNYFDRSFYFGVSTTFF